MWVSPFRYLRINGYLLLPEAFRSLSRLSSAPGAKASALCSLLRDHLLSYKLSMTMPVQARQLVSIGDSLYEFWFSLKIHSDFFVLICLSINRFDVLISV